MVFSILWRKLKKTELKRRRQDIANKSHINTQNKNRNINISYTSILKVPDKLLKIRNPRGHLFCKRLYGNNLNSYIYPPQIVKYCHFCTYVVYHKSIFTKLDFHSNTIFYEIHCTITFAAKAGGETQLRLNNFRLIDSTGREIPAGPLYFSLMLKGKLLWDVNEDGR